MHGLKDSVCQSNYIKWLWRPSSTSWNPIKANQGKTLPSYTKAKEPITISTMAARCFLLEWTSREETLGLQWGLYSTLGPSELFHQTMLHGPLNNKAIGLGHSPHSRHSSRGRVRRHEEIFNYTEAPTWGFSPTVILCDVFQPTRAPWRPWKSPTDWIPNWGTPPGLKLNHIFANLLAFAIFCDQLNWLEKISKSKKVVLGHYIWHLNPVAPCEKR